MHVMHNPCAGWYPTTSWKLCIPQPHLDVRSYLESELTEDMLKPKDNVQQEEREEVSKHVKKFFNGVPEFTELLSGAVEILSK